MSLTIYFANALEALCSIKYVKFMTETVFVFLLKSTNLHLYWS